MKVKDLIEKLQEFDPELVVAYQEDGYVVNILEVSKDNFLGFNNDKDVIVLEGE